jgi:hypothetical protein
MAHRPIPAEPDSCRIKKSADDRYFVSCYVMREGWRYHSQGGRCSMPKASTSASSDSTARTAGRPLTSAEYGIANRASATRYKARCAGCRAERMIRIPGIDRVNMSIRRLDIEDADSRGSKLFTVRTSPGQKADCKEIPSSFRSNPPDFDRSGRQTYRPASSCSKLLMSDLRTT